MIQYDWSEKIQGQVFKTWLENKGEGVKIAVLDTGVDLAHPALKKIDRQGHKFNVAEPSFDPSKLHLSGNANVTDAYRKKGHGTQCVSVLAAVAEGEHSLAGLVPAAEIFIFKINTVDHKFFRAKDLLRGLEAAANLKVDMVVASIAYLPGDVALEGIAQTEVDRIFNLLDASGAVLFAALPNQEESSSWTGLPSGNFPSLRKEAINVGVISKSMFQNRRDEIDAEPGIHFLVSNVGAHFCKLKNEYSPEAISSSYATYLVGGVAALYIASIKKREKEAYKVRPIGDFLRGMSQKFLKLSEAPEWDADLPVLYKTSAVESGPFDPLDA